MANNFDNLSIQITASATRAINQVNKLADALINLNNALNGVNAGNLDVVSKSAERMGDSIQKIRGGARTVKTLTKNLTAIGSVKTNVAQTADAAENLANASGEMANATKDAGESAGGNATNGFQKFTNTLKNVGTAMSKAFQHSNNVFKGIKKVGKSSKSSSVSASGLAKELLRVGKMMKLMITRMVLRKIISGIGDGFKNLAQYSSQVNASISLLWNSFRQLGNSIAAAVSPLLNAFAPALNYLIQLIIKAVNAINQLISALLGLGTWTRAKTLTDDYAKSLEKAGGAAKELKKTVLGFDELNQLQDNKNSGGGGTSPADMFEEVAVANKWKKIAADLMKPIKDAWNKVGDQVVKSWQKAMKRVKKLGKDVARDFFKMWTEDETTKVFENIFLTIKNIGDLVGNLANSFDRAWNKNSVGLRIFEKMRDLVGIVASGIEKITASWAKWAESIDFYPMLSSFSGLLEALKAPAEFIMGVLSDINDHFLQPVIGWLIEEGIPKLTNVFTDFVNKVDWDTLRDRIDRVATALAPFAKAVGEGLIQFMGKVGDKIAKFLNSDTWDAFIDTLIKWSEEVDADDVEHGLTIIANALIAYESMKWLSTIASGLKAFFGAFGGASAAGGAASSAAGGFSVLAGALEVLGAVWAGLALAETQKDKWFASWGERLGIAKEDTDRMAEHYKGISGSLKMAKDAFNLYKGAITGDLVEIRNEEGELVNTNAGLIDALHGTVVEHAKATAEIKKNTADKINSYKQENKEFAFMSEHSQTLVEQTAKKVKDATSSMDASFATSKTNISRDMSATERNIQMSVTNISSNFTEDKWTFSGVADGLRRTFEDAVQGVKGIWNGLADSLSGSFTIGTKSFNIKLPHLYADGGFPSQGSMFIAGESGAELVGNINGRTAVANSDQITSGIAQAVYSAMVSAGGNGGSTRYINNTIQIDGKTIARAVTVGQDKLNRLYSPTMA